MSMTEKLAIAEMLNTEDMSRFLFLNEKRLMDKGSKEHKNLLEALGKSNLSMEDAKIAFTALLKNNAIKFSAIDNGFESVPLVLNQHALCRANVRAWFMDLETVIPQFLTLDVIEQLMDTEVEWDNGICAANGGDLIAVAVVKEGESVIPVFESGCYALNVRTILSKGDQARRNYFLHGTRVVYMGKDGKVLATEDFIQDREPVKDRPWHRYPNIDKEISDTVFK